MEELKKILGLIGLNFNAIEIYLDLIKNGTSSALDISKRTGIHRSNTYDTLRELKKVGFVSEILEEKRKLFKASNPEKIKDYLKQTENELDLILPKLNEISLKENNEREISVSEGILSLRNSLKELLKENKEIFVFGASVRAFESLGLGYLDEFHKERIIHETHL